MAMAHPFFMGITFLVDIKGGKGEKSISAGQTRYAIRITSYMKKLSFILNLPLKKYLRNKKRSLSNFK